MLPIRLNYFSSKKDKLCLNKKVKQRKSDLNKLKKSKNKNSDSYKKTQMKT